MKKKSKKNIFIKPPEQPTNEVIKPKLVNEIIVYFI